MTVKGKVLRAVQDLPENASIENAREHRSFLVKVERGLQQADAGQTISHEDVRKRMAKWRK